MIPSPKTIPLNSSTYTAIALDTTVPTVNNKFNPISAYTSDGSAWFIATDINGTDEAPVPAGNVYNDARVKADPVTGNIFFAKALAGTPDMVVLLSLEDMSRDQRR